MRSGIYVARAAALVILSVLLRPGSLPGAPPEAGDLEQIIVLDPGHGGADAGVKSASGLLEKDLTLSLANRLREKLEANLGLKVILTRSGDYEVTILERAAIADHNKAVLFISLHLGASASGSADNFSAFYATPRPGEAGAASAPDSSLWKVWREQNTPHRNAGRDLAGAIQTALATWLSREAAQPLGGDWLVLKGVACPAVMVEMGCLSNLERGRSYGENSFLEDLSQVLYKAVGGYLGGDRG